MALISVILPCYNVETLIDRCLESIVTQTIGLENLEIICVDDCSTDHTLEKLNAWEQRYPENFLLIQSPENGRQGQARNIGMQYATTDWLCFIDSDDWIEKDYCEKLYAFAKTDKYDLVCCKHGRDFSKELTFFEERATGNRSREILISSDEDRKKYIRNPVLNYNAWGKLIRKDFLIENDLFFAPYLTYEDASWGSLLILYFQSAYILEEKLYHYYVNEESTVLTQNSNHHLDCITIQTMLWDEYESRGFLEKYREELEIEHIYSAYLAGLKFLILRYEKPDYNVYLLLRYLVSKRIPDYKENKYIKAGELTELYMLMLETLSTPLSNPQFMQFAENVKQIGI